MILFNKPQNISFVSRQMIAAVRVQVKSGVDGADCSLIGTVLGVRTTKNIPQYQYYPIPVNIAQYPITQYQYRSNPSYN